MDKRQALVILINHSFFLTDEVKTQLLNKLSTFSEKEIENIGTFLALEKAKSLEGSKEVISNIDKILAEMDRM